MRTIIYILLLSILTLSGVGCKGKNEQSDDRLRISLTYGVSKSEGDEQSNVDFESVVSKVQLYFFKDEECVYVPKSSDIAVDQQRVTIVVEEEKRELFDGVTQYKIVAVVNYEQELNVVEGSSLDVLNNSVAQSNFIDVPNNFVMRGDVTTTLSQDNPNMGEIKLMRLAAKSDIFVNSIQIKDHTIGRVFARQVNIAQTWALYNDAFVADKGSLKNSSDKVFDMGVQSNLPSPFYTYPNNWSADIERESYLVIGVDAKNNATGNEITYFYKVKYLTAQSSGSAKFADKLLSNYYYKFTVTIAQPGSVDPQTPTEVKANVQVMEWNTNNIEVNVGSEFDYLHVAKTELDMLNVNKISIDAKSNLQIQIVEVEAYSEHIATDGHRDTFHYKIGTDQHPTITYNQATKKIEVSCAVTTNYLAKTIKFKVQTVGGNLFENITITQYPPITVSSIWSTDTKAGATNSTANNPNGEANQTNFNLYKVSIISPFSMGLTVGDPTNGTEYTLTDKLTNDMVSPEFVFASQRGITQQYSYSMSQARCNTYQELPYVRGSWRIPTYAEILLIIQLQNDRESPVKNILATTGTYWTARKYTYYSMKDSQFYDVSASYSGTVRCVTDTWK